MNYIGLVLFLNYLLYLLRQVFSSVYHPLAVKGFQFYKTQIASSHAWELNWVGMHNHFLIFVHVLYVVFGVSHGLVKQDWHLKQFPINDLLIVLLEVLGFEEQVAHYIINRYEHYWWEEYALSAAGIVEHHIRSNVEHVNNWKEHVVSRLNKDQKDKHHLTQFQKSLEMIIWYQVHLQTANSL